MAQVIDNSVVQMEFKNGQFEKAAKESMSTITQLKNSLNFDGAAKSVESVSSAISHVDLGGLAEGVQEITDRFSLLGIMGLSALTKIASAALDTGKKVVSAFTIDPIKSGFQEYETQINATQTILANTQKEGATIKDVNAALDELNLYADKTIYNFTEMTRNIGTFTAAGVDLKTSVAAIKGIANLAAVSGSTSQQASTAMYQLSQALASGTVKLMDWNSVVNAGMGGAVFQDSLKETARLHGIAIDTMIENEGSFRETLAKGWLTSDILTETLEKFTGDLTEAQLLSKGYSLEQTRNILAMGVTANDAATKVKTFSQLVDTLKEAAQSGWSGSWRLIIGDFEEAKELYTSISDALGGFIEEGNSKRIEMLAGWKELGGRDSLFAGLKNILDGILSVLGPISQAFGRVFKAMDSAGLYKITKQFEYFTRTMRLTETGQKNLGAAFEAVFRVIKVFVDIIGVTVGVFFKLLGVLKPIITALLYVAGAIGTIVNAIFSVFSSVDNLFAALGEIKSVFLGLYQIFVDAGKGLDGAMAVIFELLSGAIFNGFNFIMEVTGKNFNAYKDYFYQGFLNVSNQVYNGVKIVQRAFETGDWSEVYAIFDNLNANIQGWFDDLITSYIEGGEGLSGIAEVVFDQLAEVIKLVFNAISGITGMNFDSMRDQWVGSIRRVRNAIVDALFELQDVQGFFDEIAVSYIEGGEGLSGVVEVVFDQLAFAVRRAFDFFATATGTNLDEVRDSFVRGIFNIRNGIVNAIDDFRSKLEAVDWEALGLKPLLDIWTTVSNGLKNVLGTIQNSLATFFGSFKPLEGLSKSISGLGDSFSGFSGFSIDFNKVIKSLDVGIFGAFVAGILYLIKKLVDGFSQFSSGYKDIVKAFTETIEAVQDTLESFQKAIQVKIIKDIAKAVIGLVAALVVLTFVDQEKLLGALGAISALFAELVGSLTGVMAVMKKFDLKELNTTGKAMIEFAAAILILSFAVEKLSKLSWDEIGKGLFSITVLIAEMAGVTWVMGKLSSDIPKGAGALIVFALAVGVLAKSVVKLSKLDPDALILGLEGVLAIILEMAIFMNAADFTKFEKVSKSSFVALAAAITVLAYAVKTLGNMESEKAIQGVEALGIILFELAIFTRASQQINGMSFIPLSLGIIVLAGVVALLGNMNTEVALQGVGILGILLGELSIAMNLIPKDAPKIAAGILILSAALAILAIDLAAFALLSNFEEAILKGLGIIALLITELGVFMVAMDALLKGNGVATAGAIALLASALLVLVAALTVISLIPFPLIIIGLIELAAALAIVLAAAGIATLIAPGLTALAGSIVAIGLGMIEIAAATLIFSAALNLLLLFAVGAGAALGTLVTVIVEVIKAIAVGFANGIVGFLQTLARMGPSIKEALSSLLTMLLEFLKEKFQESLTFLGDMLTMLLDFIVEYIPKIIETGMKLIMALFQGIRDNMYEITTIAMEIITAFINGIADNLGGLVQAAYNLVIKFINALSDGITKNTEPLLDAIWNLGEAIVNGLINGISSVISKVWDKVKEIGQGIIDKIKEILGIHSPSTVFSDIGVNILQGLLDGLNSLIDSVFELIGSIATKITNLFKKEEESEESGEGNMTAMIGGYASEEKNAVNMAKRISEAVLGAIDSYKGQFKDKGALMFANFIQGMNNKASEVATAARMIAQNAAVALESERSKWKAAAEYLIDGFIEGIKDNTWMAIRAAEVMARKALAAAEAEFEIASPSRKFYRIGKFVAMGLANGIIDNIDDPVEATAYMSQMAYEEMAKSVVSMNDILHSELDDAPTIRPVLDLDDVRRGAEDINKLLSAADMLDISGVEANVRKASVAVADRSSDAPSTQEVVKNYNFEQNNYSPKALSRLEIYRQTRNQFRAFEEETKKP